MLQNCFINFAANHLFGSDATEPGLTGDIGAIEIWSSDWLIDSIQAQMTICQIATAMYLSGSEWYRAT